ncbi:MAG TPA: hypothetical protein VFN10_01030 [Thermoanaerobaculia bacterium]|nr:hypothetical protein [Thermoanaerobaculia bacterium]
MTRKRIVDNRNRPAQPEPNEDEAVQKPPRIREEATIAKREAKPKK